MFIEPPILAPVESSASTEATLRKLTFLITAAALGVTSVKPPFAALMPEMLSAFVRSTAFLEPSFITKVMLLRLNSFSSSVTAPR